ncbi:hypothetical protein [Secundilactobacillus collinoides]|uniref:hypothetical protein n=1 Tax=Secundilactobacillus collinoides TaxID=33960 RepID=UPI000AE55639|nr:hypothetical protein [Secundilactobacillus collinoides]
MIDSRLFKLPGIMGRAIVIAVLMFIQAIMVVIQARFLSQAVVNLWNLKPVGTIVTPTLIFIVSFLARHLLGVFQQRTFYPFVEKNVW